MNPTDAGTAGLYPAHVAELCARHERALEMAGADWALIPAGELRYQFLDDRSYDFAPNPHFKAWVPLVAHPGSAIVFRRGQRPRLVYLQEADYWHMPAEEPSGYWVDQFDITIVDSTDKLANELPRAREKGIVIGEVDATNYCGIDRINPHVALDVLHNARTIKTPYELALMRGAQESAVRGHIAAELAFDKGMSEYDIHVAYCLAARHRESELPYNSIVALNSHAAVLHYQFLDRTAPVERLSFLIDAGASEAGYAADITRTYPAAAGDFADLVQAMDAMQLDLISLVRAGLDYRVLHLTAHRRIGEVMIRAGLASGSAEELFDRKVTAAFFPHGLGHFLGLQVHDVGGLTAGDDAKPIDRPEGHEALRLTRNLTADQVLTIEPGIYFIPLLLDKLRDQDAGKLVNWPAVDALIPYGGIRIEDNVRVLDEGSENLTRDAFAAAA